MYGCITYDSLLYGFHFISILLPYFLVFLLLFCHWWVWPFSSFRVVTSFCTDGLNIGILSKKPFKFLGIQWTYRTLIAVCWTRPICLSELTVVKKNNHFYPKFSISTSAKDTVQKLLIPIFFHMFCIISNSNGLHLLSVALQ